MIMVAGEQLALYICELTIIVVRQYLFWICQLHVLVNYLLIAGLELCYLERQKKLQITTARERYHRATRGSVIYLVGPLWQRWIVIVQVLQSGGLVR